MPRIIHLADIHLGARPYGFQERWQDILETFEDAMDKALEERPDLIVIAGDLFDQPKPENSVVRHAVKVLRKATSRGIPIVAAHGEHDTPGRRDNTILQVLEAAVDGFHAPLPRASSTPEGVAREQTLEVGGVKVLVYPFRKVDLETRRKVARLLLPAFSRIAQDGGGPSVFLAHFSLDSVFPIDSIASPSELPPVDYVALGHVHVRHIERSHEPAYAYTGSLDPLNLAEARAKHARGPLLVDIEPGRIDIQELPVEVRPQLEVEGEAGSLQEAVRLIRAAASRAVGRGGKPPLIHLKIKLPPGVPLRRLYQEAAEIRSSKGVLVRVAPERVEPDGRGIVVAGEGVNPIDILTGEIGLPRGAAQLILELKEALLEEDYERVEKILEKLSSNDKVLGRWAR